MISTSDLVSSVSHISLISLITLTFSCSAGKPTKVYIDLFIRTMGPVADLAYTYSFNCYFRQKWTDDRLHFNKSGIGTRQLSLSMAMLDKIWKPDTVGGDSYSNLIMKL